MYNNQLILCTFETVFSHGLFTVYCSSYNVGPREFVQFIRGIHDVGHPK